MNNNHQSVRELLDDAERNSQLFRRDEHFAGPKRWLLACMVFAAAALGFWLYSDGAGHRAAPVFETKVVGRGDLTVTVNATGNLQPLNQVDIGTELSGTVASVSVDYNDKIHKGQELARLNTTQLDDDVRKRKAALVSARAQLQQAQATVKEKALELERLRELKKATDGRLPARAELDAAVAADARAGADRAVAEANVESAQAELRSAQTSLGKAIITSPIDGVVLERVVEPGQTVAASLSAPTLFTLAEDLSQMELEVSVDEADIGRVTEGLEAEFTVDAWPGRKYPARVTRVSLGSSISDNVVSYSTLMSVDNPDQSLRPGMTATATITTNAHRDVLLVPNAALRFEPPVSMLPPGGPPPGAHPGSGPGAGPGAGSGTPLGDRPGADGDPAGEHRAGPPRRGLLSRLMPGPPMGHRRQQRDDKRGSGNSVGPAGGPQRVWVLDGDHPRPLMVETGISDGHYTEITGGELTAGMKVITAVAETRG